MKKCPNCGRVYSDNHFMCDKCHRGLIDYKPEHFTPRCPTCGSSDLRKIGTGEKVVNFAMFGIFGNRRKYQFHCNSCGYEW